MSKSKHDFVDFVQKSQDPKSVEASEMYNYLVKCFVDNDSDYDGLVSYKGFNNMIHETALAPRRYGFAPHTREMYKTLEEFEGARTKLFNELSSGDRIGLCEWVDWAKTHIAGKAGELESHSDSRWERSEADFVSFFKGVTAESSSNCKRSSSSTQFKEFYMLCLDQFKAADSANNGSLDASSFDTAVGMASAVCGRFGRDWYSGANFADVAEGGKVTLKGWFDYNLKVVAANN
jgi:hypothetical protein